MNQTTRKTDNSNTVASVVDLATDVDRCKAWLATRDGRTNRAKSIIVLEKAINAGRSDICQLILDSKHLKVKTIPLMGIHFIETACYSGHLSMVQLLVSRFHPRTQQLYVALATACARGHVKIVVWLLMFRMKLSLDKRARWLLATASACGDIDTVRILAAETGLTATEAMSQALKAACYEKKVKVIDWLMMNTSADASVRSKLAFEPGEMTSLTAACFTGHFDIVRILLQCVTPHTVNIQCGDCNDSALHFVICSIYEKNWKHSLHNACSRADIGDVSVALHCTNVDMINQAGDTPLHLVCQNGSIDIVRMLMSVFARVDITNDDRHTPIQTANRYGNKELVQYMSHLLDVTDYTPSSSTGANVRPTTGVTQATVDIIVSDLH
jgi:hypothetical protein